MGRKIFSLRTNRVQGSTKIHVTQKGEWGGVSDCISSQFIFLIHILSGGNLRVINAR